MEVKLLVVNEKAGVKELVLGAETYIGRSAACHLRISSSRVSRKHCLIRVEGQSVFVRDLGSSNGTVLDGLTVASGVDARVRPGSKLGVGPLKFIFDFEAPEAGDDAGGYVSPADILALPESLGEEDDTKDYLPSKRKLHAGDPPADEAARTVNSAELAQADSGKGDSPLDEECADLPPLTPDETVYDPGLADHARDAVRRARDERASVLSDSGTDVECEPKTPLEQPPQPSTRQPGPNLEDPALDKFLKQFGNS